MNKLGNTLKFVSGIILFVIGVVISYEVVVYNLIDVLMMVGFLIAIVGIILIISYFVDSNVEKTSGILKDFLDSADLDTSSINLPKMNSASRKVNGSSRSDFNDNGPLIIRQESDDYDYGNDIDDSGLWEYYESEEYEPPTQKEFTAVPEIDDSKAVLRVVNREEKEVSFDNELNFTPNYEKPIKVTRRPKKRSGNSIYANIPQTEDKSEEIQRALSQDVSPEITIPTDVPEPKSRDIAIDINNPERLPVPSALKSNILTNDNIITSDDAFEQLAVGVNKEIMLEIPSLNKLSDRFLSHVPTIYSRVIIDEFDLSDISYTVLIASLLKQGVHIRTIPKVRTVNLITDDSHAMILSENKDDSEYGAIYSDRISISNIRSDFEKTWDIASNLDETVILNSITGGAA